MSGSDFDKYFPPIERGTNEDFDRYFPKITGDSGSRAPRSVFELPPEPEAPPPDRREISKGFSRGLQFMIGSFAEVLPAIAYKLSGNQEEAEAKLAKYRERLERAMRENPAAVQGIENVRSIEDFANYASGVLGELAPNILLALTGAGAGAIGARAALGAAAARAGAVTGAVGAGMVPNTAESLVGTVDAAGGQFADEALAGGLMAGAIKSALDAIPIMRFLGEFGQQAVAQSILKRVGKGALGQARSEGITEGMQEVVDQVAQQLIDQDREFWTDENVLAVLNSMAAGAIGGGVMGAGAGVLQRGPAPVTTPARPNERDPGVVEPTIRTPEEARDFLRQNAIPLPANLTEEQVIAFANRRLADLGQRTVEAETTQQLQNFYGLVEQPLPGVGPRVNVGQLIANLIRAEQEGRVNLSELTQKEFEEAAGISTDGLLPAQRAILRSAWAGLRHSGRLEDIGNKRFRLQLGERSEDGTPTTQLERDAAEALRIIQQTNSTQRTKEVLKTLPPGVRSWIERYDAVSQPEVAETAEAIAERARIIDELEGITKGIIMVPPREPDAAGATRLPERTDQTRPPESFPPQPDLGTIVGMAEASALQNRLAAAQEVERRDARIREFGRLLRENPQETRQFLDEIMRRGLVRDREAMSWKKFQRAYEVAMGQSILPGEATELYKVAQETGAINSKGEAQLAQVGEVGRPPETRPERTTGVETIRAQAEPPIEPTFPDYPYRVANQVPAKQTISLPIFQRDLSDQSGQVVTPADARAAMDQLVQEGYFTPTEGGFRRTNKKYDRPQTQPGITPSPPLPDRGNMTIPTRADATIPPPPMEARQAYQPGEEVQITGGVDVERLLASMDQNVYKDGIVGVATRELLQNSYDAVKAALHMGKINRGKIQVVVNRNKRTITFKDNGIGMDLETLTKAYFQIMGSSKRGLPPELRSGGLGRAKVALFRGANRIQLETVSDGTKYTADLDPNTILRAIGGDTFSVRRTATTDPNGTSVTLTIPKAQADGTNILFSPYEAAYYLKEAHFLNGTDITFQDTTYDHSEIETIKPVFEAEGFHPQDIREYNFPWGKVELRWRKFTDQELASDYNRKYGRNLTVLSSGAKQFAQSIKIDPLNMWSEVIPAKFVLNILPKVDALNRQYPFTDTRDDFRPTIQPEIASILDEARLAYKQSALQSRRSAIKRASVLNLESDTWEVTPGETTLTTDANNIYYGDPNAFYVVNLLNTDIVQEAELNAPGTKQALKELAGVFKEIHTKVQRMGILKSENERGSGRTIRSKPPIFGFGFHKEAQGFYNLNPFVGFFINPAALSGVRSRTQARNLYSTYVHELTHDFVFDHSENFTTKEAELHTLLSDEFDPVSFETRIENILTKYQEQFAALKGIFDDANTRNDVSDFTFSKQTYEGGRPGSVTGTPATIRERPISTGANTRNPKRLANLRDPGGTGATEVLTRLKQRVNKRPPTATPPKESGFWFRLFLSPVLTMPKVRPHLRALSDSMNMLAQRTKEFENEVGQLGNAWAQLSSADKIAATRVWEEASRTKQAPDYARLSPEAAAALRNRIQQMNLSFDYLIESFINEQWTERASQPNNAQKMRELRARYEGVPVTQIPDAELRRTNPKAFETLETLRKMRNPSYMPQMALGTHFYAVYDKSNKKRKLVEIQAFNPRNLIQRATGYADEGAAILADLQARYGGDPKYEISPAKKFTYDQQDQNVREQMDAITEILTAFEVMKPTDRRLATALDNLQTRLDKAQLGRLFRPNEGILKAVNPRNEATYVDTVMPRYLMSMAKIQAARFTQPYYDNAYFEANEVDPSGASYFKQLRAYSTSPTEFASSLRSLTFLYLMGGAIDTMVVNMLQPIQTTAPMLIRDGGVRALKHFTPAYRQTLNLVNVIFKSDRDFLRKLNEWPDLDERAALIRAHNIGTLAPLYTDESRQSIDPSVFGTVGIRPQTASAAAGVLNKFVDWMGKPMATAEQVNRTASFLMFYRAAKENPKMIESANRLEEPLIRTPFEYAVAMTQNTQFLMTKEDRSLIQRFAPGAELLTQFMSFPLKMVEQIFRHAWMGFQGFAGNDRTLLRAGALGFIGMIAPFVALGGIWAVPFAGFGRELLERILGYVWGNVQNFDDDLRQFATSVTGSEMLGEMLVRGGSQALGGPALAGRMSLDPINQDWLNGLDLTTLLGPFGSITIDNGTKALKYYNNGDYWNLAGVVLPRSIGNLIRGGLALSGEDIKTIRGNTILPGGQLLEREGGRAALMPVGFTPATLQRARDYVTRTEELNRANQIKKERYGKELSGMLTDALRAQSRGEYEDAQANFREFTNRFREILHEDMDIRDPALRANLDINAIKRRAIQDYYGLVSREASMKRADVPVRAQVDELRKLYRVQ